MAFIDFFKTQFATLSNEVAKYQNKDFLAAVVASAVAISAADGEIDRTEKDKLNKFIQMHDALKLFKPTDIAAAFSKYAELFEFSNDLGMQEVLKQVNAIRNYPDQAKTMLLVACAIGAADGDFDEDEKGVARKLCVASGLRPQDFNL